MDSEAFGVWTGVSVGVGSLRIMTSSFFLFDSISMTVSSLPDVDCDSLLGFEEEEGLPRPAWSAGEGTTSPPVRGRAPVPEAEAAGG